MTSPQLPRAIAAKAPQHVEQPRDSGQQQPGAKSDQPAQRGNYTFRHTTHPSPPQRPQRLPLAPRRPAQQARQRAPAQGQQIDGEQQQPPEIETEKNMAAEAKEDDGLGHGKKKSIDNDDDHAGASDSGPRSGNERPGDEPRRDRLKARVTPQRPKTSATAAEQLARSGLPGAKELFGPASAAPRDHRELQEALVSLLLGAAQRDASQPAGLPGAPRLATTATTLAASLAVLERQSNLGTAPQAMSMGQVKALLMSRSTGPLKADHLGPAAAERLENSLLLLPLVVHNTARPRWPGQQQRAKNPLRLLSSAA